jgi:hypothetical protein
LFVISFGVGPSLAGPGEGTAVFRTNEAWGFWFFWNDDDPATISVHSSDPTFLLSTFCDGQPPAPGDEWMFLTYQDLAIASQKRNFLLKGPTFTRVYRATSGPVLDNASACSVLKGERGPLIAEGISTFHWTDINTCDLGSGKNTWYGRAVGTLSAPSCASGMAHFRMNFHYMLANDGVVNQQCLVDDLSDIRSVVIRGPEVTCLAR